MRSKITHAHATVSLSYDDIFGERIRRTFWVPVDGGYVRENGKQVCERLSCSGSTLISTRATLLKCIRREYSAMRRSENNLSKWV